MQGRPGRHWQSQAQAQAQAHQAKASDSQKPKSPGAGPGARERRRGFMHPPLPWKEGGEGQGSDCLSVSVSAARRRCPGGIGGHNRNNQQPWATAQEEGQKGREGTR